MRVPSLIWAILVFVLLTLFFEVGIAPIAELLTGTAAPLPSSLARMYEAMTAVAILLYFSYREDSWVEFLQPLNDFVRDPRPSPTKRRLQVALLIVLPLFAGWVTFRQSVAVLEPPIDPPGIHFNLPNRYISVRNPLPWTEENISEGGALFTKYCAMCHGDTLDGNGLFARALQPRPANFRDSGTIAQLDENYVFWRIKEGAPGLPAGTIGYRSAMPIWDGVLTETEIWKIIMYEYTNAGVKPAKRE
ncbi:MAG: cytochrome c [Gammaproteobacteria bacterium]|nr:cytochrome c [Gammaproteobacteria bacterium]